MGNTFGNWTLLFQGRPGRAEGPDRLPLGLHDVRGARDHVPCLHNAALLQGGPTAGQCTAADRCDGGFSPTERMAAGHTVYPNWFASSMSVGRVLRLSILHSFFWCLQC